MAQAREVRDLLKRKYPHARFKLTIIKTIGDEFQAVELFQKNKTGIFTKSIEERLLKGGIDIAVHSLKDLPTQLPAGLGLAAFPKREDPADVLISRRRWTLRNIPKGSRVGTASPRRRCQILRARPDLDVRDIRGNLDTRVRRALLGRDFDAIVVARAGLLRLGKYLKYASSISPDVILPAVGQGALAIEARSDDAAVWRMARSLNDRNTENRVLAERSFLEALEGGCRVPVGISSNIVGKKIRLQAAVFSPVSDRCLSALISGSVLNPGKAGTRLAKKLLSMGAGKLLTQARQNP